MKRFGTLFVILVAMAALPEVRAAAKPPSYLVVISEKSAADPNWKKVADRLGAKHEARLVTFQAGIDSVLPELKKQFPKYVCFVATREEATREFVSAVHRLTRQLDDDPYTDVFWGILTGFDAANALEIAAESTPLVIKKVASGTEIALDRCEEGLWFCELNQFKKVEKALGAAEALPSKGPGDTTEALVNSLNQYHADLFVTSGHATERDWQIGFRYRNGSFRCQEGQLYGLDTNGRRFDVESRNPKVYMPIGNCLMGHIDGSNAMALAFMKSAGVRQMLGYVVPTWYGYAGWGCLDYFVEQPGRFTFTEAFFANQHALIHRLENYFPELLPLEQPTRQVKMTAAASQAGLSATDGAGLLFDRDVLAFYGDPAWAARMADGKTSFGQSLEQKDGVFTLTMTPNLADASFDPVNLNGSQRGYRPFVQFLPERIDPKSVKLLEGANLKPVIADDFILIPHPGKCDPGREYKVSFKAANVPVLTAKRD